MKVFRGSVNPYGDWIIDGFVRGCCEGYYEKMAVVSQRLSVGWCMSASGLFIAVGD